MPIPDALKAFAGHFGLKDSETLSTIFGMLYDHKDDLVLLPALPGTVKEVSENTGIPEQRVKEELHRLALKGAVMKLPSGKFVLPDILLELRDFSAIWPEAPKEFFKAWQKLIDEEYTKALSKQRELGIKSRSRTLIVDEAVPSQSRILDRNSIRKIITDAPLITTVPCPCRLQAQIAGKRTSDCPAGEKSFCIQTGGMAQALVNRGIATVLSTEEALQRIDEAAAAGLVHNVTDFVDDYETASKVGMSICNCCPCCCILLYSVYKGFPEILGHSGFKPVLNPDACIGCGECETRCPFHAISTDGVAAIDPGKCLGCGNCAVICPEKAIAMEKIIERQLN
jgi:ferredoxin